MKKIGLLLLTVLSLSAFSAKAQYMQNRPATEWMFKVDLGYAPFVANLNAKGEYGYYLNETQSFAGLNVAYGKCISQDYFLGLGVGYNFFANPNNIGGGLHGANVHVDFDYRPLSSEFSPMVYAKAGASYLMHSDGPYGNTITPLLDAGVGCNWYFSHAARNMERNYKSMYLTIGIAYIQQTAFLPIRLGLRF